VVKWHHWLLPIILVKVTVKGKIIRKKR